MARSSTSFQPGNTAAVTHGARSPRLRESKRKELADELRTLVQSLLPALPPQDAFLVDLLVDVLTDVRQLRDYVNSQGGPVSPRGHLYKPLEMLRGRERDAIGILDRLGVGAKTRQAVGSVMGTKFLHAREAEAAQLQIHQKYGQSS